MDGLHRWRQRPAAPHARSHPAMVVGVAGAGLSDGLPPRLRRLLHRALHFLADSRHGRRQARRHALHSAR
ncbi:protein of unknown function [Thauera humireducens]|nr:protein of unknown function [Thauera humireducens]